MKMAVLSNLEPKKVFYYFEEITKIPHGSGNVDQISDFLVDFAKAHKLFYIQDAMKNVIIVKEATPGYENEPVVILQGHMDMVAVQTPECTMDMKTEGLKIDIDGDNIYAEGTSLGGDDGIAVAYALALLDSEEIKHPRLEVIITVDEEVGMDGAREIDLSMLQGHRMINLDSEDEGIFLTSCAGGARVNCRFPMKKQELTGMRYELEVSGLLGGHSGGEIHKERGNSNCILGRLLWKLSEKMPVGLVSVDGGLADNAIPRQTKAVVVVEEKDAASLEQQVAALAAELGGRACYQGSRRKGNREKVNRHCRDNHLCCSGRYKTCCSLFAGDSQRCTGHERRYAGAGTDFSESGYPESGCGSFTGRVFCQKQRGKREGQPDRKAFCTGGTDRWRLRGDRRLSRLEVPCAFSVAGKNGEAVCGNVRH